MSTMSEASSVDVSRANSAQPITYSSKPSTPPIQYQKISSTGSGRSGSYNAPQTSSWVVEDDEGSTARVDKPDMLVIQEIVSLLKVKTSMLAIGACERVKRTARAYPKELCNSPIVEVLVGILATNDANTPLCGAAMAALTTLATVPEGRQQICILGGLPPVVKLGNPNTDRAIALLMNLSADHLNRKQVREANGVEALVAVMRIAPMDTVMEHAMGALHNIMLTDVKAKKRATDAGVAYGLARILATRMAEGHIINVRARMLISDLLQIPDMQVEARLQAAAAEMKLRLPAASNSGQAYNGHARPSQANSRQTSEIGSDPGRGSVTRRSETVAEGEEGEGNGAAEGEGEAGEGQEEEGGENGKEEGADGADGRDGEEEGEEEDEDTAKNE